MVNKINLGELDASDMCDVLHFFFEEDLRYASPESAEMMTRAREHIYGVMYGVPYNWGIKSPSSSRAANSNGDYDYEAESFETKSYVAPTDFNGDSAMPFGSVLDSPIGQ
jgi:hypothetical protein